MKKISFAKLNGAGNDFILFDLKFNPELVFQPSIITQLCNRRTGIGADGIIVISALAGYDFKMDYYNADGSTGSLCGNGARCAIKYAYLSGKLKNGVAKFFANGSEYSGRVIDDKMIRFNLNQPKDYRANFRIDDVEQVVKADFINTGSPHVVINVSDTLVNINEPGIFYNDINDLSVVELGKAIRYSDNLKPDGANVNFIQLKEDKIFIRTYERGVEDETLACGTGSVAAALICYFNRKMKPPIRLITKSGEQLTVDFKNDESSISNLSLIGPAEITFTGEFYSSLYFNMED